MKAYLMIAAIVLGSAVSASAAEITGVLVDKACYTKDKANTTNAHKGMGETCAQACAKKGGTVSLVTEKGEVYDVMTMGDLAGENNAKLMRTSAPQTKRPAVRPASRYVRRRTECPGRQ